MNIDPFTLLLIVLFVVLPILNSLTRRQQPGQRPPPRAGPPGQQRPQATTRPAPSAADDELARRIEEARRRVQQALGEEPRPKAAPPKPKPEPPKPKPKPAAYEAVSLETLTPLERPSLRESAPLEVDRRVTRRAPPTQLSFDRASIIRGVIWREILDKPLAERDSWR
jgi:hypothetical protein